METIPFIKMHGLGNNFVIISDELISHIKNTKTFIKKISSTSIGIGCDQVISYKKNNDFITMNVFNQDGSKAKTCGNASRCISRLIFDQYGIRNITIKVGKREITVKYYNPETIIVNMGTVSFYENCIPVKKKLEELSKKKNIPALKDPVLVNIGNLHLVIFDKLSDKEKKKFIKVLEKEFDNSLNINFAQISNNSTIYLKVWERGAGFTKSCGSGASASFAAANKLGLVKDEAKVVFKLGFLKINKKDKQIFMTGSASYIFRGEYYT